MGGCEVEWSEMYIWEKDMAGNRVGIEGGLVWCKGGWFTRADKSDERWLVQYLV